MKNDSIHVIARAVIIDQNNILVCKTQDLPNNFYFLPGGHIEHEESAVDALVRELKEESGFTCKIGRFLGCLEHIFTPGHNSICHNHEYNLFFNAVGDGLNISTHLPQLEKHIKLEWVPLDKIHEIDFRPEALKTMLPKWLAQDMNQGFHSSAVDD